MIGFLKRLVGTQGDKHVDQMLTAHAAGITSKVELVRDGIAYCFEEHESGLTYVHAARRTKPFLRATFHVESKADALAWREDGTVPLGETTDLLRQLQAGTWPKSHNVDDII